MITEEEYTPIKLREHCIKSMQFSDIDSNAHKEHELILKTLDENISLKYRIEQLETEKQNLIEKLEEKLERNNRDIELAETGKLNLSSEEWAEIEKENKLINKILSYMKGEEK